MPKPTDDPEKVRKAQRSAVKLLKEMAREVPLRSDTRRREKEIDHIVDVLGDDVNESQSGK